MRDPLTDIACKLLIFCFQFEHDTILATEGGCSQGREGSAEGTVQGHRHGASAQAGSGLLAGDSCMSWLHLPSVDPCIATLTSDL